MRAGPFTVVLTLACAVGVASADVVERRGSEPRLQGTVVSLDDAGVKLRTASGAIHAVPWDRVRRVQCDPVLDAELARWMPVAEDLWRARSRLQRRDTTMAEPLLERLFERYRGHTHETALTVAEGLLRCRLARADHTLAVIPALETARLRRAGITTGSYAGLSEVLDDKYALCPLLAPVWVPSPLLHALERELGAYDAQGDEVIAAIALLYRRAVLGMLGRSETAPDPATLANHPGTELLDDLVGTSSSNPDLRQRARERLRRARRKQPEWAEAWSRFFTGTSLVAEEGLGRRQRGILQLLHLPARFAAGQPFLAGVALAEAAAALEQTGDHAAADILRAELARSYPDHPAQRLARSSGSAPS